MPLWVEFSVIWQGRDRHVVCSAAEVSVDCLWLPRNDAICHPAQKRAKPCLCVVVPACRRADRAPPPCRRGERNRAAPCSLHLITRTTINVSRPMYALKATRLSVPLITVIPQSNLAKSHYAAASRVPLIQSPSLRVPRPVSDSQSDPAIPYCIVYQVDLPPDIHPLPESINAYVSPFACFTQSPLHRHINLRAFSCCYTTRVLPLPP